MTEVLIGGALGTLIAFILAIPAIILEASRRMDNLPLLIDVHFWKGRKLTDGEVFLVGLAIHLLIGFLYGILYIIFAENNWLFVTNTPYALHSMVIFALICWAVLNIIIFPIVQFGIFGRREGFSVWYETLITLVAEGLILWVLIHWYQPFYFFVT